MRLVFRTAFVRAPPRRTARAFISRIKAVVAVVVDLVARNVRETMRFVLRVEVRVAGVSCVIHHGESIAERRKKAREKNAFCKLFCLTKTCEWSKAANFVSR